MTNKRHFSQEEKYTFLMNAKDIGVDKAAEIAGLSITRQFTDGVLTRQLWAWRLTYRTSLPGLGVV